MQVKVILKHWLKLARWQRRRAQCALRWGVGRMAKVPAVLGNAMPKSGSHLIIQILQGLTEIGPFVDPGFPPVNRSEDNRKLSRKAILANIQWMRPGDIGYGYIGAQESFISALARPGRATVFVYRDPRDMLVSHVFYATDIHHGHGMHRYYTETLKTMDERLSVAIHGIDEQGLYLPGVRARYEQYLGWLEQPAVLCLRFEDLILDQAATLNRFLDYLAERGFTPSIPRQQAIQTLQSAIQPRKSGTFRKGQPGNWREYFSSEHKRAFNAAAGDLLIRLGYEKTNKW